MYKAEIILANGNNLAVTNHGVFSVSQEMAKDKKSMKRICFLEAQKLFIYDGIFNNDDKVEGIVRIEVGETQELKYFTGIMLSLNMGLAKIRLNGELKDENIEQFLKKIERYEFSR